MDARTRGRFFRRLVVAAIALLTLTVSAAVLAAWAIADHFGRAGGYVVAPLALACAAVVILLAVSLRGMRRLTSPLVAVMEAADQVADGNYAVRIREYGPPPMRALAQSFNTMTERLQNADRLRRDLMADVAHELRTPLTVLQGRLEGLLDGVYARDDRQLSQLLDDTRVLSRLVEDLRTLALSEAGALQLHAQPTDLIALVHDVARSMQAEAGRKSIAIDVETPAAAAPIDLDAVRIREVLTNLLSNAVRHTPAGRRVSVALRESGEAVAVTVTDTGEGIPPDEVPRIFDRFYKSAASGGSGLGLSIAKALVSAHGGEISASSELNRGTTIVVTLPRT